MNLAVFRACYCSFCMPYKYEWMYYTLHYWEVLLWLWSWIGERLNDLVKVTQEICDRAKNFLKANLLFLIIDFLGLLQHSKLRWSLYCIFISVYTLPKGNSADLSLKSISKQRKETKGRRKDSLASPHACLKLKQKASNAVCSRPHRKPAAETRNLIYIPRIPVQRFQHLP